MDLYLRWLDNHEPQAETEESPFGLTLSNTKDAEQIEPLQLAQGEIRVAECWTGLPARELLKHKLHEAVRRAREQLLAPKPAAPETATASNFSATQYGSVSTRRDNCPPGRGLGVPVGKILVSGSVSETGIVLMLI
jgi:hypothetical protein